MDRLLAGAQGSSRPIAIGAEPLDPLRPGTDTANSWHGSSPAFIGAADDDVTRAPVIGSMPVSSRLQSSLPPLTLPASVGDATATISLSVSLRSSDGKLGSGSGSGGTAASLIGALSLGDKGGSEAGSLRALSLLESSEFKSHVLSGGSTADLPPRPPPPPGRDVDDLEIDDEALGMADDDQFGFEMEHHAPANRAAAESWTFSVKNSARVLFERYSRVASFVFLVCARGAFATRCVCAARWTPASREPRPGAAAWRGRRRSFLSARLA
ncbi:hypothetical protein JL721_5454 [Aureococcus anophagefferens]|nr:hypothetical protein JL721_5454 [Aureococcus anophagefferens]